MSDATLTKKLQIKAGQSILLLNAPVEFQARLEGLDFATEGAGGFDSVHLFVKDSHELKRLAPQAFRALKADGRLWIAYPKLSSGVKSDLTRDEGWEAVFQAGYRPVTQAAIDETWSALRFKPTPHETGEELVEAQFAGPKAALRPIYDRLLEAAQGFGADVTLNPRQSYIALSRKVQFAALRAGTSTRFDVGLRLKNPPYGERLTASQGLGGGSINCRVSLTTPDQVDAEVLAWLRQAYEGAG